MAAEIERRFRPSTQPIEIRSGANGASVLSGYGAVYFKASDPGTQFELWPGYVERIAPGAFDRAIREDDVRGLYNHDANFLLGRTKSKTMRLSSDDVGLKYEIDVPDSQVGRDVAASIKRGDLDGSSFSFSIFGDGTNAGDAWVMEGETMVRTILAVRLYDVGPVVFPAYEATTASARDALRAAAEKHRPAPIDNGHDRRARDLALREKS